MYTVEATLILEVSSLEQQDMDLSVSDTKQQKFGPCSQTV